MAFNSFNFGACRKFLERKERLKMKRSKKVCLSFCVTFILLFTVSLCCPIYAAEYGGQYPAYLEQSGSCFIECQTNLGRGTIVVPLNYTNDTFGFYGDGSQVMNLTSYTISGYFVTQSGTTYEMRFTSFSIPQYVYSSDWSSRYQDLTVTAIYNTNVSFVDDIGDRGSEIYNFSSFQTVIIAILLGLVLFVVGWLVLYIVCGRRC